MRPTQGRTVWERRSDMRLARQLDAAQKITHIGSWEWDLATGAVTWSDEMYRIYGLAPRSCAITLEGFSRVCTLTIASVCSGKWRPS